MRVTPDNFHLFKNRFREVVEFARGGRDHKLALRTEYSELVGASAEINMSSLSPEELLRLGPDLQAMV